ncbi:phage portal protein [Lysobacter sp. CA199]|uniref:phage portal protein n=1 Tax=Lysobacter sp. CA199 TaxID=3455608 RepID=UPI003F8D3D82
MTDAQPTHAVATMPAKAQAFTFGDPVPVLDSRGFLEHTECAKVGRWYEPPVSLDGLARAFRSSPHHASAIHTKCNILVSTFVPHRLLSSEQFEKLALDTIALGNGYLERRNARSGKPLSLRHALARYTRRGIEDGHYFFNRGWEDEHEFVPGTIFHLMEPDLNQELYGVPQYVAALQSALLNESATLFRRKYYLNGSHAGFIMYVNDAAQDQADIDAMRQALKDAKGVGNFRNLFLYSPNGKKDGVQVIPISEVAARDEFLGIKGATRDDILAAHRVPPQLLGMPPNNTGGFGDVEKAARVFARNELIPLQTRFRRINEWVGDEIVRFLPYELGT